MKSSIFALLFLFFFSSGCSKQECPATIQPDYYKIIFKDSLTQQPFLPDQDSLRLIPIEGSAIQTGVFNQTPRTFNGDTILVSVREGYSSAFINFDLTSIEFIDVAFESTEMDCQLTHNITRLEAKNGSEVSQVDGQFCVEILWKK